MPFDSGDFKRLFPLFSFPENSGLVYLDNAATTQRPQAVIDAVANFYLTSNANTHRSSHRLARRATEMVEQTRVEAARFLNASVPEEIVFTRGATEALNLLASSLTEALNPRDEIVLTTAEHHANLVPWQMAAHKKGLVLKFVPETDGVPQWERLLEVLSERTRILAITGASNALGFKTDLTEIKRLLVDREIVWVVDAAQLAAHSAVNVQEIGCDYLVCSAHKFYGPTGVGLLYGKQRALSKLPPWQGGGEMIRTVELQHSSYAEPPHRFETGTSSLAAIAGLEACFGFWRSIDRQAMEAYEKELIAYLHCQLEKLPGIKLLSNPQSNVGIATFVPLENTSMVASDLAHWLDEFDIAVRVGHHCAMPLMRNRYPDGSSVRVSIAAYNDFHDVDKLVAGISAAFDSSSTVTAHRKRKDDTFADADDIQGLSLEELRKHKGWQQRYRQLMKWSSAISAKPKIRIGVNLVNGCESDTWVTHSESDGCHRFFIDSDARVVKGLAVLLLLLINNKTTAEIHAINLESIFSELGLERHLSPSRNNGFRALVNRALELVEG